MVAKFVLNSETLLKSFRVEKLPCDKQHLLVACFPKSGSTWLSETLSLLPGYGRVDLVPDYGRREQELTFERLLVFHSLNYVAQHHCRYSRATQFAIDAFSLIPIILVRNIFDCVVSVIDHLDTEDTVNAFAYVPNEFRAWDQAKKIDFVIEMIMPWYMNFFVGWNDFTSGYWINYEQLVSSPFETIQKMAGELKQPRRNALQERTSEELVAAMFFRMRRRQRCRN